MCVRAFEKFFHVLKNVSIISFFTEVEKKNSMENEQMNVIYLFLLICWLFHGRCQYRGVIGYF